MDHSYGDELIITVAEVMKKQIRDEDLAVRLGGDEFLILFKDVDADESEKIWSRIVANFNEINEKEKRPYIISASHGIIEYDNNQKRAIDDLITKADEKMYLEKEEIKRDLNVIRPKV
ncbi:putative diguanylate cyclase DgcE [bioreactor metagenome]|uniref:Putative diguanylate cyclase DgcE n=1 Tax=bioreactor metagenome TaxID=1076179 RepID=A0A645GW03_9ZZZZ